MKVGDYARLSGVEIAAQVRDREVSAREVTAAALDAIEAAEPRLHAFATVARTQALEAAETIDARLARGEVVGPLAGTPVVIKDLLLTKGLRTTFGSRLYADYVPEHDDIVVERLRAAGAVVIGKSNASEFGFGAHGNNMLFPTTRNPWDLSRGPGGSSAGSAAAVAAGVCALSIGSDGGGSIRIPASLCGLVGVKASMGRVPLWPGCRDETLPGVSGWESIEHVGPITRAVADAALMLSVIAGPDPRDRWSLPAGDVDWLGAPRAALKSGLKALYWPRWGDQPIEPAVSAAVTAAVEAFAKTYGVEVETGSPPDIPIGPAFPTIIALETDLTGMRRLVAEKGAQVSETVRAFLDKRLPLEAATDAITTRKAWANAVARLMSRYDLILTPTLPVTAFAADREGPATIVGAAVGPDEWCPFTFPFNLTGQPAASVFAGMVDGLPVGLQIVGPHLGDALLLTAAAKVEALFPAPRPAFTL
jgi:aspartyl-tRNA(Asn)/glutamyl-tRNA(Gln) amidotransferase subunit A